MTKLRKYGIIFLVLLMALVTVFASSALAVTSEDLKAAFNEGGKITLDSDIAMGTETLNLSADKSLTLDLAGFTISAEDHKDGVILVDQDNSSLIITDSSPAKTGKITRESDSNYYGVVRLIGDTTVEHNSPNNVSVTIESGTIVSPYYSVVVKGKGAVLTVNGGTIEATDDIGCAISGNGRVKDGGVNNGGTEINITGGKLIGGTKSGGNAIYHPQLGTLTISDGELSGYDGIQLKSGTLKLLGGTITATGDKLDPVANNDGAVGTGAALSLITSSAYIGSMDVVIAGTAKLEATGKDASAVYEGIHEKKGETSSASELKKFAVSSGTLISSGDALSFTSQGIEEVITITGGTYSSDPKNYVREPYVVEPTGDTFTVKRAGVFVTPDTAELVLDFAPRAELTASSEIIEDFTWALDDDSVVTLENNNGKITVVGVRAGTANVTATGKSSGSVGKCVVTVRKTDPVSVTPANMELKIGETGKVKAKYYVEDSVSWSSSNEDVATVKDGTVTAGKKAGVAIITAKGLYTSAACTLTVIDPVTPDPTPTPAPVDPGTVGKEKNPVNNEKDKPENVEAATPAIKEATEDAKDDIAGATNIKKENLVATANGTLTISPVLAKSALEEVMSADKEVAPKNVVLLPIVSTNVKEKNVAAMAFSMTGAQLGAEDGTVAGDVKIIKVLADGKGAQFGYASSAAGYQDETFTLKDANDKTLALTDKVVKTSDYKLIIFVADDGKFDLDKTPGSVVDPIAVATNAAKPAPTPHSSSSGCNAGFAGLLLLTAVPFIYRRKR